MSPRPRACPRSAQQRQQAGKAASPNGTKRFPRCSPLDVQQRRPSCDCGKNVFILPNPGLQQQRFQVCVAKCWVPSDQPSAEPPADSEIPRKESSSSAASLSNCRRAGPNFSVVLTCVTVTPARVRTTTTRRELEQPRSVFPFVVSSDSEDDSVKPQGKSWDIII